MTPLVSNGRKDRKSLLNYNLAKGDEENFYYIERLKTGKFRLKLFTNYAKC